MNLGLTISYMTLIFLFVVLLEPRGTLNMVLRLYAWARKGMKHLEQEEQLEEEKGRGEEQKPKSIWFYLLWPMNIVLVLFIWVGDPLTQYLKKKMEPYTRDLDHFLGIDD